MSKKATNTIIKLPHGILDAACVSSVSPAGANVACIDANSRTMAWLETEDNEQAKKIANLLGDRVLAAREGRRVEPINWAEFGYKD